MPASQISPTSLPCQWKRHPVSLTPNVIAAADMEVDKLKFGRGCSIKQKRMYAGFDPRSPELKSLDPLTRSEHVTDGCEKLYLALQESKGQHSAFSALFHLRHRASHMKDEAEHGKS